MIEGALKKQRHILFNISKPVNPEAKLQFEYKLNWDFYIKSFFKGGAMFSIPFKILKKLVQTNIITFKKYLLFSFNA